MDKKIKNIAGVSIIEILIAMIIVSIALITIAGVFPRMSVHGKSIHESDQAKIIAAQVLEGLQMFSTYRDTPNCGPDTPPSAVCGAITPTATTNFNPPGYSAFVTRYNTTVRVGQIDYTVRWVINTATPPNNSTVTVTVTWHRNGRDRSINVVGLVL
jgi:type II secretory pathway pseudopilin PulG